ncbi:CAP domain-containing protein [Candidatus Saccharibacteria bacterium]|nr:CAP domain-containing protein [Candidatus Saccharibacteria bacterium]
MYHDKILKGVVTVGAVVLIGFGMYMVMDPGDSGDWSGEDDRVALIGGDGDRPNHGYIDEGEEPPIDGDQGGGSGGGGGVGGGSGGGTAGNLPPPESPARPRPEIAPMVDPTTGPPNYNVLLPVGELWRQTSFTMFATANVDLCIDRDAPANAPELHWISSDMNVVRGFRRARTFLGFSDALCVSPDIFGVGRTTITARSADGSVMDTIELNIVAPNVAEWELEVVRLVNVERRRAGVPELWIGDSCRSAANTRAREIVVLYSHTRPGGGNWRSLCPAPTDVAWFGGENIHRGSSAVSPATVVADWMRSADHRANILNPNYMFLTVSFFFDKNTTSRTHWVQLFTTW